MIRKTLTVLSLIGLPLCVGACVASMWDPMYESDDGTRFVALHKGRLYIHVVPSGWGSDYEQSVEGIPVTLASILPSYESPDWTLIGHESDGLYKVISISRRGGFVLPLYLPFVAFSIVPGIWVWRSTRLLERRRLGLCVKCGYDLRGSKDRCPECGKFFLG